MGRYVCGPSILRRRGRQAIVPGEIFDEVFTPAEEKTLIEAGAICRHKDPAAAAAPVTARPSRRSEKKPKE